MLLVDGAIPVRDAADVLDHLHGAKPGAGIGRRPCGPSLGLLERRVLDAVEQGAGSVDALASAARLSGPECAAALARLELAGYVEVDFAGRPTRTLLAIPPGSSAP
jgi:predicted Rossmann fold nucleotide-binding protein DprA/Smf involved in DNA uptake